MKRSFRAYIQGETVFELDQGATAAFALGNRPRTILVRAVKDEEAEFANGFGVYQPASIQGVN